MNNNKDEKKDEKKDANKKQEQKIENGNKSKEESCLFNDSKSLATIKYKLIEGVDGIHEFVPLLFEEANFCVANLLIHTIRLGTRINCVVFLRKIF